MKIINKKTAELIPYINNARTHSDDQVKQVAASIQEFGFTNPVLVDSKNSVIAGHCRLQAATLLKLETIPCIVLDGLTESQKKAYIIADNKLAENSGWNDDLLKIELESLNEMDFDLDLLGFDSQELDGIFSEYLPKKDEIYPNGKAGILSELFIMPPFSVFDSKKSEWVEKKRNFKEMGFCGNGGRENNLLLSKSLRSEGVSETSEFDPVLCEILIKWFSPKAGMVVDPFAGGPVRGVISSLSDRKYTGIDVRESQITYNKNIIKTLNLENKPVWIQGDSTEIDKICHGIEADFLFSCPPYHDLEKYSNDPKDISNMDYLSFLECYRTIIKKASYLLKDNRFACFVVSEIRDKNGNYKGFVGDTITAFTDSGLEFYNEGVLINNAVSLGLRCRSPFIKSRKLGRMHQNILIFVKGDPKKAADYLGPVNVPEIEDTDENYGEVYNP